MPEKEHPETSPQHRRHYPLLKEGLSRSDFLRVLGLTMISFLFSQICSACTKKPERHSPDLPVDLLNPDFMAKHWNPELQQQLMAELPRTHQSIYTELNKITEEYKTEDYPFGASGLQHDKMAVEKHINTLVRDVEQLWREYQETKHLPHLNFFIWKKYLEVATYLQLWINIHNLIATQGKQKTARIIYNTLFNEYCKNLAPIPQPKGCNRDLTVPDKYRSHLLLDIPTLWNLSYLTNTNLPSGVSVFMVSDAGNLPYTNTLRVYDTITSEYQNSLWHKPIRDWAQEKGWPTQELTELEIVADPSMKNTVKKIQTYVRGLDLENAFGLLKIVATLNGNEAGVTMLKPNKHPPIIIEILKEKDTYTLLFILFHELFHFLYYKTFVLDQKQQFEFREMLLELFFKFNPFTSPRTLRDAFYGLNDTKQFSVYGYPLNTFLFKPNLIHQDNIPVAGDATGFTNTVTHLFGFMDIEALSTIAKRKDTCRSCMNPAQRQIINRIHDIVAQGHFFITPETTTASLVHIALYPSSEEQKDPRFQLLLILAIYTIINTRSFEETLANIFGHILASQALKKDPPKDFQGATSHVNNIIDWLRSKKLAMEQNHTRM